MSQCTQIAGVVNFVYVQKLICFYLMKFYDVKRLADSATGVLCYGVSVLIRVDPPLSVPLSYGGANMNI